MRGGTLLTTLFILFLVTFCVYAQERTSTSLSTYPTEEPTWQRTLLVKLKPHLTDTQVDEIAKEYGCSTGKIYRFDYNDKPHITVKFFIQEEIKSRLDLLVDMTKDERILSVIPDIPGKLYALSSPNRNLRLHENAGINLGLSQFWSYYTQKIEDVGFEVKGSLIVLVDTGIWDRQDWIKEYLLGSFRFGLEDVLGGPDVIDGDNIAEDDVEDATFRQRHGTGMASIMAGLMPVKSIDSDVWILPVRYAKSGGRTSHNLSNAVLALESAMQYIKDKELDKDFEIIVNMSWGFELDGDIRSDMALYWDNSTNADKFFEEFKQDVLNNSEYRQRLEQAGYVVEEITFELLKQEIREEGLRDWDSPESELLRIAEEWLYKKIYIEGSITRDSFTLVESDTWSILREMHNKGFKLFAGAGNKDWNGENFPPAVLNDWVTAIAQTEWEDVAFEPYYHGNHGEFVDFAFYKDWQIYNEAEGSFSDTGGSSSSTAGMSSIYAQAWRLAGNVSRQEMDEIFARTAVALDDGTEFGYGLPHPYRVIRVSWVYGRIKYFVEEYENSRKTEKDLQDLKDNIAQVLQDTESGRTFADIMSIDELFRTASEETPQPLSVVLDILIENVIQLIPADGLTTFASLPQDEDMLGIASYQDNILIPQNNTLTNISPFLKVSYNDYPLIF